MSDPFFPPGVEEVDTKVYLYRLIADGQTGPVAEALLDACQIIESLNRCHCGLRLSRGMCNICDNDE